MTYKTSGRDRVTLGKDQSNKKGKRNVKYHTTVSQRNFMKILSLGGVGLGTAGLGASGEYVFYKFGASCQDTLNLNKYFAQRY